jgi:ATP-dependent RNA helicase DeaD
MSDSDPTSIPPFTALGLSSEVLKAIEDVGYESPSPIQAECIPHLLKGEDLLGQAQTGTGKTGAFALPLLSRIDVKLSSPQILVLTPTRELAIQVAEAFQTYARYIKGFHVLPIYGGQSYEIQLRPLRRGVHVVVGTPGRVMDHIKRKTLKLNNLKTLVLDEADEMLRMGFIDDVKWVLEQTPENHQIALFSATMPDIIRKVAKQYLKSPHEIKIKTKTSTATTIRQRYWQVSGLHKLDALTRILEVESFDGVIIFARTKNGTVELADKLSARGYAAESLNGDIPQNQREKTVSRLKQGKLDILVATDVAARGLDVERVSHVINYDIPYDTESYVHRIGRTGRAGRKGDAILFVAPREKRMLYAIERATKQSIERMQMPSVGDINEKRVQRFKERISGIIASKDLELFDRLIEDYQHEAAVEPVKIAAALAYIAQGDEPFILKEVARQQKRKTNEQERERGSRDNKGRDRSNNTARHKPMPTESAQPLKEFPDIPMERYRLAVGKIHDVKPGNIVGAVANEADIESKYIGVIEIYEDFSTIDLPEGMPKDTLQDLRKARVCGRKLDIDIISSKNKYQASSKRSKSRKPRK